MSLPPFAHLTVRSCYSLRDGAIRPRELASAAALLGMTHVALTDRDGLYGAVRFARACQVTGVTPVFGADLALAPDPRRPGWEITRAGRERIPARRRSHPPAPVPANPASSTAGDDPRALRPSRGPAFLEDDAARVTFLARTQTGYGNLCRTVSAAHRDLRSSPHLAWEDLTARSEGLYVLLGAGSPVGRLVAAGRLEAAAAEARGFVEAFGPEQVLIGVRHHLARGDDLRAARTVRLADDLGLTPVAVNDVRYLREEDAYLADVLACVRGQVPVATNHVGRTTAEGWFKTATDLRHIPIFCDRPDLLTNAGAVAESCQVDLVLHDRPHVPRLTGLTETEAARELHVRCWVGVQERYDRLTPEVTDRLRRELAMVTELGLHDYFLTVADIVAGIRELSVLTACRGSAASSSSVTRCASATSTRSRPGWCSSGS